MKTLKTLTLALAALFLLAACSGGNSPGAVVEKYFKAAQNADFETAKTCVTKEVAAEFDKSIGDLDEDDLVRIKERNRETTLKLICTEVDGDDATVYFEVIRGEDVDEHSLPLKKEDGKWKIAILY